METSIQRMDASRDFIEWLGQDLSVKILMCLGDPCDLIRVSAVSSTWRQFVITAELCKQLCISMFPETSRLAYTTETKNIVRQVENAKQNPAEWACLEREHRAYASLSRCLTYFARKNCIINALYATSTDNYPKESIMNTLESSDVGDLGASYWSSKGQSNPSAPETLIYGLVSRLCLVTEVHVHPFQAYFQFGLPIYSAKAVRFQLGHPKVPLVAEDDDSDDSLDAPGFSEDKFVWTYTSPEFPMAQENQLQKFKLPKPVVCIGGVLKVELLGRVQAQEMDGLYYICIDNVQAVGSPLLAFDIGMIDELGNCKFKYYPERVSGLAATKSLDAESSRSSRFRRFSASLRTWEQMILNTLRRSGVGGGPLMMIDDEEEEEKDSD